jgi:hypothetical protein
MGRTACTEPQCLYKGALYLTLHYALVQWIPAECGVSERDRDVSIMMRPWSIKGCCAMEKK